MKLKTISCLAILSLLSSLGFSAASDQSGINLYSEASAGLLHKTTNSL